MNSLCSKNLLYFEKSKCIERVIIDYPDISPVEFDDPDEETIEIGSARIILNHSDCSQNLLYNYNTIFLRENQTIQLRRKSINERIVYRHHCTPKIYRRSTTGEVTTASSDAALDETLDGRSDY